MPKSRKNPKRKTTRCPNCLNGWRDYGKTIRCKICDGSGMIKEKS